MIILFYFINIYEDFESCKIITCQSGYKIDNNVCKKDIVCTSGQQNINGTCISCPPINNVLSQYHYDINCNPSVCKEGYQVLNKNCDTLCSNGSNVISYINGCNIKICKDGYIVDNQANIKSCVCKPIKDSKTIDTITCNATSCNQGYAISNDGKKCELICDSGKKLLNGICVKTCDNNYISINDTCTLFKDEYVFTNCGATGRLGPTLDQCNTYYKDTNLQGSITMEATKQGIQIWTVPVNGKYHITCAGAGIQNDFENCRGVIISSVFDLKQGDKIKILIGQSGNVSNESIKNEQYGFLYGSGSGGTFVVKFNNNNDYTKDNNTRLIIAGGGGGNYEANKYSYSIDNNFIYIKKDLSNASYETSGQENPNKLYKGGIDGNGGTSFLLSGEKYYGGGGFYSDGTTIPGVTLQGNGISFLNGGYGGNLLDKSYAEGGFGGGSSSANTNGSGGGYSGGAGSYALYNTCGFGGGSYCLNLMEKLGYNNGMGYVNIKFLGES